MANEPVNITTRIPGPPLAREVDLAIQQAVAEAWRDGHARGLAAGKAAATAEANALVAREVAALAKLRKPGP